MARDAENIKREVIAMGGKVIDTGSDAIMERGISRGKAEFIVELLESKGEVSEALREQIFGEQDINALSKWLKLSAKVHSVEEFIQQMN